MAAEFGYLDSYNSVPKDQVINGGAAMVDQGMA